MKIKRKPPKLAKSWRPAFVIGSSFPLPSTTDLKFWFDLQYGGPLRIDPEGGPGGAAGRFAIAHAIWSTSILYPLPDEDTRQWRERLGWGHTQAAAILHRAAPPLQAFDMQLFVSRLARGLTLLSQGTAYDVATESFLNPSDWKDLLLTAFALEDHLEVGQSDSEDPTSEWFRTMGLSKFGLDELEAARPRGLDSKPTLDLLRAIAAEVLRSGQNPSVGSTLAPERLGVAVRVVSLRTIPHTTGPLPVRRVQW